MKKITAALASLGYFINVAIVYANTATPTRAPGVVEQINIGSAQQRGIAAGTGLQTILQNAITLIFSVAALLVLGMLIWGAISWTLSGGDKEKVGNARKMIVNALVGLAILALAFLIARVVGEIIGFNILTELQIPALGPKAGS